MRAPVRRKGSGGPVALVVALAAGFAVLLAGGGGAAPEAEAKPRSMQAVSFPDSIAEDLHAAWALRARVGGAYWPEWAAAPRAPLVLRGNPFDFFVNHPSPPQTAAGPAPLPGGGGTYEVSAHRLEAPSELQPRIENQGGVWCVPYNFERGRPGTRADVAAVLAYRDFLVFETTVGRPVWATPEEAARVRRLKSDPDLIAWLDQEGVALRRAVAAEEETERVRLAGEALQSAEMADLTVRNKKELAEALAWARDARRFDGPAHYLRILLEGDADGVVRGDTAQALGGAGDPAARPGDLWRRRAAGLSDRAVTGGHLGSIAEVGALYCVLLDAWSPGWQKAVFKDEYRLHRALAQALKKRGVKAGQQP